MSNKEEIDRRVNLKFTSFKNKSKYPWLLFFQKKMVNAVAPSHERGYSALSFSLTATLHFQIISCVASLRLALLELLSGGASSLVVVSPGFISHLGTCPNPNAQASFPDNYIGIPGQGGPGISALRASSGIPACSPNTSAAPWILSTCTIFYGCRLHTRKLKCTWCLFHLVHSPSQVS